MESEIFNGARGRDVFEQTYFAEPGIVWRQICLSCFVGNRQIGNCVAEAFERAVEFYDGRCRVSAVGGRVITLGQGEVATGIGRDVCRQRSDIVFELVCLSIDLEDVRQTKECDIPCRVDQKHAVAQAAVVGYQRQSARARYRNMFVDLNGAAGIEGQRMRACPGERGLDIDIAGFGAGASGRDLRIVLGQHGLERCDVQHCARTRRRAHNRRAAAGDVCCRPA